MANTEAPNAVPTPVENKKEAPMPETTRVTRNVVITTPTGTGLWYDSATIGYDYGSNTVTNGWTTTISDITDTVTRKLRRFQPKKKRGDTSGANSPDKRLKLVSPVVMYGFVKSRFRLLERKRFADRLEKIAKLMESTRVLGQIAMADRIEERFGKLIREQELLACGYDRYLPKKLVQKFIELTSNKIIKLTPLKNYVRPIPKNIQKIIDDVTKRKLVDELVVMHTDVNNTAVAKTKAEKKDPILFGVLHDVSDNYYFLADWVDEWCDLTFDQLIDKLDLEKEDYEIEKDVEKSFLETIL